MTNLDVESARSEQRVVEIFPPIGGAQNDDARIFGESIHLSQHLIDSVVREGMHLGC